MLVGASPVIITKQKKRSICAREMEKGKPEDLRIGAAEQQIDVVARWTNL